MNIPKKIYDALAWCGRYLLPAASVFYGTIGEVWSLPYTKEIPLTITAVAVFINAVLGINSKSYFEAHEIVEKGE